MSLTTDHHGVLNHGDIWSGIGRNRLNRTAMVRTWLAEIWRAWTYRRSIYRTERALMQLDNRALRDLGLDRSMIPSTARAAANLEIGLPAPDERRR
jgi:uncharacterized protein YjiS (DUF1127 family)